MQLELVLIQRFTSKELTTDLRLSKADFIQLLITFMVSTHEGTSPCD